MPPIFAIVASILLLAIAPLAALDAAGQDGGDGARMQLCDYPFLPK